MPARCVLILCGNHIRSLQPYDNHGFLENLDAKCGARVQGIRSIRSVLKVDCERIINKAT
jgi:hypothetical protein